MQLIRCFGLTTGLTTGLAVTAIAVFATASCTAGARDVAPGPEASDVTRQTADDPDAKKLFEVNCSVCHSLDLPKSQRLNRADWEWVVSDMVEKFGATWITEEQQRVIVDFLVRNYGRDRRR
jgi:cytochrome c5